MAKQIWGRDTVTGECGWLTPAADIRLTNVVRSGNSVTFTMSNGQTWTVPDVNVSNFVINNAAGTITITETDGTVHVENIPASWNNDPDIFVQSATRSGNNTVLHMSDGSTVTFPDVNVSTFSIVGNNIRLVETDGTTFNVPIPAGWSDVFTSYTGTVIDFADGDSVDLSNLNEKLVTQPDGSIWLTDDAGNHTGTVPLWTTTVDGLVMKARDIETTQDYNLGDLNDPSIAAPVVTLDDTRGITSNDFLQLFRANFLIRNSRTVNVGVDARFPTLKSVFDYLIDKQIDKNATFTIQLPAGVLSELSIGPPHSDSDRIVVRGAPMVGAFPARGDWQFTGITPAQRSADTVANAALLRSRFATRLVGPTVNWTQNTGYGRWDGVLLEGLMRFSDYNIAHTFLDCAVIAPDVVGGSTAFIANFSKGLNFSDFAIVHLGAQTNSVLMSLSGSYLTFTNAFYGDCQQNGVTAKYSYMQFASCDYIGLKGFTDNGFGLNQNSSLMLYTTEFIDIVGGYNNIALTLSSTCWVSCPVAAGYFSTVNLTGIGNNGPIVNVNTGSAFGPRYKNDNLKINIGGGNNNLSVLYGSTVFLDNVAFTNAGNLHISNIGGTVEMYDLGFGGMPITFDASVAMPVQTRNGGMTDFGGRVPPAGISPAIGVVGNFNAINVP